MWSCRVRDPWWVSLQSPGGRLRADIRRPDGRLHVTVVFRMDDCLVILMRIRDFLREQNREL